MFCTLAVVVLVLPVQTAAGITIVTITDIGPLNNPGFEQGLYGWTPSSANDWTPVQGTSYAMTDEDGGSNLEGVKASRSDASVCSLVQQVPDDQLSKMLGRRIEFSFFFKSTDDTAMASIEYAYLDRYENVRTRTISSGWMWPSDYYGGTPWTHVPIQTSISSAADVLWVKVKIFIQDGNGDSNTLSYVDAARIRIIDVLSAESATYGNLQLRVSLDAAYDSGMRTAWLSVGVGADSLNTNGIQYYIGSVTIKTTKYVSGDYAVVQQAAESNNVGYYAAPASNELIRLYTCAIVGAAVGAATRILLVAIATHGSAGTATLAVTVPAAMIGAIVGTTVAAGLSYLTESLSPFDISSVTDSYTSVVWNYKRLGIGYRPLMPTEGGYGNTIQWNYVPQAGHTLKIDATVEIVNFISYPMPGGYPAPIIYEPVVVCTLSTSAYLYP